MKKNIVIIILSVIILGLGGYLVYDKVIDKNEEIANKENEEIVNKENEEIVNKGNEEITNKENRAFDFYIAKTLIDYVKQLGVFQSFERLSKDGLTEELKLAMSISKIHNGMNRLCNEAFDTEGEYRPSGNNRWLCRSNDTVATFFYDTVNKEYKNLFGKSLNAPKIRTQTWVYDYSTKLDAYVKLTPAFGPIVDSLYYYAVEDVEITDERLKIKISYLSYRYTSLGSTKYFTYYLNDVKYSDKTEEDIIKAYEENKNQLPKLIFTYEIEDGKYLLKSVE